MSALTAKHLAAIESVSLSDALDVVALEAAESEDGIVTRYGVLSALERLPGELLEGELLEVFDGEPSDVERRHANQAFADMRERLVISIYEGEVRRRLGQLYALESLAELPRLGPIPPPHPLAARIHLAQAVEREPTEADLEHFGRVVEAAHREALETIRRLCKSLGGNVSTESWPAPRWAEAIPRARNAWRRACVTAYRELQAEARASVAVRLLRASTVFGHGSGSLLELLSDVELFRRAAGEKGQLEPPEALERFSRLVPSLEPERIESSITGPLPVRLRAVAVGWRLALSHHEESDEPLTEGQAKTRAGAALKSEGLDADAWEGRVVAEALVISAELAQILASRAEMES